MEAFLANSASMPVDNLWRQHVYDIIADRNKTDPCESEEMESVILDQLDKQQKQKVFNFA